jgi:iron complex outermembrane receptor protein
VQTGKVDSLNGARFVFAGEYKKSDGALTFSPIASWNVFAKGVIPLGDANTLTLLTTYNKNHYYQSDTAKGATCGSALKGTTSFASAALDTNGKLLTQLTGEDCAATSNIGLFGKNYALTDDATQPSYWRYNRTDKHTCRWTTGCTPTPMPTARCQATPAPW